MGREGFAEKANARLQLLTTSDDFKIGRIGIGILRELISEMSTKYPILELKHFYGATPDTVVEILDSESDKEEAIVISTEHDRTNVNKKDLESQLRYK